MEYLFSIFWKSIRIGMLYHKDHKFIYIYDKIGITKANEYGFDKLIGFPDINKVYISDNLFPIFDSRIISNKRNHNITSDNKIKFLIETKGKLVTDNITIEQEDEEYGSKRI